MGNSYNSAAGNKSAICRSARARNDPGEIIFLSGYN